MNASKALHKLLEKTEFYKTGTLQDDEIAYILEKMEYQEGQTLIDTFNVYNSARVNVAKISQDKYGDAPERVPGKLAISSGKITDGVKVGIVKSLEKGSIGNSFEVIDLNDNVIATLFIMHYPSLAGNLNTKVDGKSRKFKFEKNKADATNDPTGKRKAEMIKYLLNLGYL